MENALHVLVIDDSVDDRTLYRRVLAKVFGEGLNLAEASNGDSVLDAIEKNEPSCVLLDYSLPGRNGIEVMKCIRSKHPHLPIVLLTGQGNEAVAVQSMREGAQDYITKATITAESLARVIRMAIENSALKKRVDEQHVALELFTQALAHDLKEPVRTVCSFAQMICNGEIASDRRDEYMRYILDAGDRMALLVDSVLSYTQLDSPDKPQSEVISLNEAVASAKANLSALFRERGATVSADSLPDVVCCRIQIIQVLQNLMSNAISHSKKPVHIRISAMRDGASVRVVVADDGPGIPWEHQSQIFEPFRRLNRDNEHCGLGLAVCRKIVEAHRGKMGCESEVGVGSRFFFTLPDAIAVDRGGRTDDSGNRREETVAAARQRAESTPLANLLVVDDRDDDILFTRSILTGPLGMRCNFLVANDGKAALALIRDRLAMKQPVDLILLDINMPIMNGFEMLAAMGEDAELSAIPVVMCSGSPRGKDKERSRELGAVGYLVKPVRLEDLRSIISASSSIRLAPDATGRPILTRVA